MFENFFSDQFDLIKSSNSFDSGDSSSVIEMTAAASQVTSMFFYIAVAFTIIFLVIASIPKYSFKLGIFTDITARRAIFFIGLIVTSFVIFSAYAVCFALCNDQTIRPEGSVAWEAFYPFIRISFYISFLIYPLLFWAVAFCFDKFLHRRKLNTIFKSSNKIFGLI